MVSYAKDSRLPTDCPPPRASKMAKISVKMDPPGFNDAYMQCDRQPLQEDEKENSATYYSTVTFSKELEIHGKQPTKHCGRTPRKSILRTKSEERSMSRQRVVRRRDTLLEKVRGMSPVPNDAGSSRQLEPLGPAKRRQDWNIESLFPPSPQRGHEQYQSRIKSRREEPSRSPARTSEREQFDSSEYLLRKYAVDNDHSSLVWILPLLSPESENSDVARAPKGSDNEHPRPYSDSKLYDKSLTRRRLAKKGGNRRLSYLQLEESNRNGQKCASDNLELSVGNQRSIGYDVGGLIQTYSGHSPRSSITSCDELLIRNSTNDTQDSNFRRSSDLKRFDWDKLHKDNARDFDDKESWISNSKRSRMRYKAWAVWVLIGIVISCLASFTVVYLTVMDKEGNSSISSDHFGMGECTNHEYSDGRFVSDRYYAIRRYLLHQSAGNVSMMDQAGSPQREALCWISDFDDYNIDATNDNKEAIIQRYSLAVVFFSTFSNRKLSGSENIGGLINMDFLTAQHECNWEAIMCDHSRAVTIFRLSNKSLSGNVPPEIGNLMSLIFIDLSLNKLTGSIPTSIAQLSSLEYLSLAFNNFKTSIPTVFGRMTTLTTLNLRSSEVLQRIPKELGYLSNLELLLLDDNSLSGTIPRELGNLFHAEQMDFRKNNISGIVPIELCGLHSSGILKELGVDEWIDCDCCI